MNAALALLTLALAFGVALAPTAAASCPPSLFGTACPTFPLTGYIDCIAERAGNVVDEVLTDCI